MKNPVRRDKIRFFFYSSSIPIFHHSNTPALQRSSIPTFQYSNIPAFHYSIFILRYPGKLCLPSDFLMRKQGGIPAKEIDRAVSGYRKSFATPCQGLVQDHLRDQNQLQNGDSSN